MKQNQPTDRYMCTVTVGAKGQIVIPKQMRDMFHIHPGDELLLLAHMERGIAIPSPEEARQIQEQIFSIDPTMRTAGTTDEHH